MQDFTNYSPNQQGSMAVAAASSEALFFQRIYVWMFAGLAVTAGLAFVFGLSDAWMNFIKTNRFALIGAAIVELGVVFYLSARINTLAPSTAKVLFMVYAALTGVTFSVIGRVYPPVVIFKAFISTAGIYGAMAVYGMVTKRSLQAWGSFLFMGLVGIIIASVVNMFVHSSAADLAICVIGVLLFAGLTAYDHQKLRVIHATALSGDADEESRVVIMGALNLYLDFINLFLLLLRLFGRSND
ncbi:MAG: Bax inhibitor-1/YccA family protein [Candidatus Adiutrix sp.]|jgi:FtsH-binding integral membrane protein|nr:Bax inhibitor-1/YccA family protein [Candidatus Adiutrix sp.]